MTTVGLEEAYEKWAGDLVSYASALVGPDDAADVVAEAFTRLLERPDGPWASVREPRGYLFTVTLNAARLHHRGRIRRERREWRHTAAVGELPLLDDPAVVRALAGLSLQQRAVTYLTSWEDLDPAGIAAMLGISEGAVRRQLARARAALRKVLA